MYGNQVTHGNNTQPFSNKWPCSQGTTQMQYFLFFLPCWLLSYSYITAGAVVPGLDSHNYCHSAANNTLTLKRNSCSADKEVNTAKCLCSKLLLKQTYPQSKTSDEHENGLDKWHLTLEDKKKTTRAKHLNVLTTLLRFDALPQIKDATQNSSMWRSPCWQLMFCHI